MVKNIPTSKHKKQSIKIFIQNNLDFMKNIIITNGAKLGNLLYIFRLFYQSYTKVL